MEQTLPEIPARPVEPGAEVRSIMTPGVVTMPEDASLAQVCRALRAHGVHAVLIVESESARPLGWATVHGMLAMAGRELDLIEARDATLERPVTISPSATVAEAAEVLESEGVSHLVVGRRSARVPEGVVSEADVIGGNCR